MGTALVASSLSSAVCAHQCESLQTCESVRHMFRSCPASEELFPHLGRGFLVCFPDSADLLLAIARSSPPVSRTSRRPRCPSAIAQLVLHPSPAGTFELAAAVTTQDVLLSIIPSHADFLDKPPKHPPYVPADSLLSV